MRLKLLAMTLTLAGMLTLSLSAPAAETATPGKSDRCPVCGMFVAGYTNWISTVVFKDGSRSFFDGPKDLFRFYFGISRYRPGATTADIKEMFVTEYYSVQHMPVSEVYFVSGSDVLGPMGKELVPVAGLDKARGFMRDHGGTKLMRFDGHALVPVPDSP